MEDHLSCPICYNRFDCGARKPIDLGCGHCFCQACFQQEPAHFRRCPECRARSSNPHPAITVLRVLQGNGMGGEEPAAATGTGAVPTSAEGPPASGASPAAAGLPRGGSSGSGLMQRGRPLASTNGLTHGSSGDTAAAIGAAVRSAAQQAMDAMGVQRQANGAGPGTPPIETLSAVSPSWMPIITFIIAFLYLVSPLDIIPDFVPLIGWLDDIIVFGTALYYLFQQQQQSRHL